MKKIAITSDHGGFLLKKEIITYLKDFEYEVFDMGPQTPESVDYPDYAEKLAHFIKENKDCIGIAVCGSGIGMSIALNRYPFVRAALVYSTETARLSRQHNNANVICLGARLCDTTDALTYIDLFLNTDFMEGHHCPRVQKLGEMK